MSAFGRLRAVPIRAILVVFALATYASTQLSVGVRVVFFYGNFNRRAGGAQKIRHIGVLGFSLNIV